MFKRPFHIAALLLLLSPSSALSALDAESTRCIGCHEPYTDGGFHSKESSHPVGLNYVKVAASNPSLKEAALLDPAIRLAGGYLGCESCHSPYSEADHEAMAALGEELEPFPMLVMKNDGSRLCISCHMK